MKSYFYILLCILIVMFVQICPADEIRVPETVTETGILICNVVSEALKPENVYIRDDRYLIKYEGEGKSKVAIYDLSTLDQNTFNDYVIGDRNNGNFSFTRNMKEIFLTYIMNNSAVKDTPYFTYYDEEDKLQFELYFGGESVGYGICYNDEEWSGEIKGFRFREYKVVSWEEDAYFDQYELSAYFDGIEEYKEEMRNYEEQYEYNDAGQITEFYAKAETTMFTDDWLPISIASYSCVYYDNGNVKEQHFFRHSLLFGTSDSTATLYYDEKGRITYIRSYITHGSLEHYFIYEDDGDIPAYGIVIDHYPDVNDGIIYKYTR